MLLHTRNSTFSHKDSALLNDDKRRFYCAPFTHHLNCPTHPFKVFAYSPFSTVLQPVISFLREPTSFELLGGNPSLLYRAWETSIQHSNLLVVHHPTTIYPIRIEIATFSHETCFKFSHQLLRLWKSLLDLFKVVSIWVPKLSCCGIPCTWLYSFLVVFTLTSLLLPYNICTHRKWISSLYPTYTKNSPLSSISSKNP